MRAAVRKSRREQKRRLIAVCLITLCLVFLLGLTFGSFLSRAKEDVSPKNAVKYYANIEIQPGDTLWDLADQYLDDHYTSKDAYIAEVLKINSLDSVDYIVSGQYLVMPYYGEIQL